MGLVFFFCALFLMLFLIDWQEKKQRGDAVGWRYLGGILACLAVGLTIGGGFFFWQVRPNLGECFPDWLGISLAGIFLFLFWFFPTIAVVFDRKSGAVSPAQEVNKWVGEETVVSLGVVALMGSFLASGRWNLSGWAAFLLLFPLWGLIFYLWHWSNRILIWLTLCFQKGWRKPR